jgi:hypothetical protein
MAQRFVDVNVDSLTDKDLLWADMAFIGGMAVQRKSAKKIIARCNASNLKVVAGEPLYTSFTKEFAIHRKRWALKRSPGENDGGNCEESLRIEYFMQWRARSRRKGNIMPKNLESKNIDQLLAEADELIQQINSDAIKDMEEEHRIQFEKHIQNLKKIKSEVQGKIEKKGTLEISSSADGIHEAIQDIVKAMKGLKNYLFWFPSNAFE